MKALMGLALILLLAACESPEYSAAPTGADRDGAGGVRDVTVLQKMTCKKIFETVRDVDHIIDAHNKPGDKKERDKWCGVRSDLEDAYTKGNCTDLMLPFAPQACLAL